MSSTAEPRSYPFVDPLHGETVVFIVGPDSRRTGVAHPDCTDLAPVAYGLDSAYCAICRWQCRISGAWALDMIENLAAVGQVVTPATPDPKEAK